MRPTNEIAWATGRLLAVEPLVPMTLRPEYDRILAALRGVHDCEDLPKVIIHNDCHPGNAVQTADGTVVLIDWEGAGWAPAVIDIGFLLVSCDTESPWTPHFDPDSARVRAVIDGYCRYHLPAPAELDRLVDTMRFRTIVYGVVCFAEAIAEHGQRDDDTWWRPRYEAADELATRARALFEQHLLILQRDFGMHRAAYTDNPKQRA
jgi:Ser/Thr protein kinase RdoA (MazF antagonist)